MCTYSFSTKTFYISTVDSKIENKRMVGECFIYDLFRLVKHSQNFKIFLIPSLPCLLGSIVSYKLSNGLHQISPDKL